MTASTSDNGDPARINLRTSSTASLEKRPGPFGARSARESSCRSDPVACSISFSFLRPAREAERVPEPWSLCSCIDPTAAAAAALVYRRSRQRELLSTIVGHYASDNAVTFIPTSLHLSRILSS